jgi:hypothetical protein
MNYRTTARLRLTDELSVYLQNSIITGELAEVGSAQAYYIEIAGNLQGRLGKSVCCNNDRTSTKMNA